MHVDELQGIRVQLDSTGGITVGLFILQQHKCPHGTLELAEDLLEFSGQSLPVENSPFLFSIYCGLKLFLLEM